MARSGSYGGRNPARWVFIVLVLLIAGGVYLFITGRDEAQVDPLDDLLMVPSDTTIVTQAVEPIVETTAPRNIMSEEQLTIPQTVETNLPALETSVFAESNSEVATLISTAFEKLRSDPSKLIEVRNELNRVLNMSLTPEQEELIKGKLTELSQQWLFSSTAWPSDQLCSKYKVASGDLLSSIGTDHKVPYEILMRINNISRPESLRADQSIKVVNGPFHAKINKSRYILDLYLQNTYVRSFPVGLARAGYDTPSGLWLVKIGGKMVRPAWTDPDTGRTYQPEDPDYPLGARWIGLEGRSGDAIGRTGFALHGTNEEASIGTSSSRGCVRLHNENILLMYEVMMPGHSQVKVVD